MSGTHSVTEYNNIIILSHSTGADFLAIVSHISAPVSGLPPGRHTVSALGRTADGEEIPLGEATFNIPGIYSYL